MKSDRPAPAERLKSLATGEIGRYLFFGVLTTLVNNAVFALSFWLLGEAYRSLCVILSFTAAVLFAYVVNRRYVFKSTGPVWPEIALFSASRLLISLIFELGFFHLVYDVFDFKAMFLPELPYAKLPGQLAVIVANYVVGKFGVFKDKGRDGEQNTPVD